MACMWSSVINFFRKKIITKENLIALAVCFMVIIIIIFTTDSSPQWIYQGF
jgi:hypothetical protein